MSPEPEESQNACQKKGKNKRQKHYWRVARVTAVFGIIELFSLVLWAKSEDFDPSANYFIRWIATCGFLAGAAYLAHELVAGRFRRWIISAVWVSWAGLCCLLLAARSPTDKRPHLVASLYIGDSPRSPIVLTNELLSDVAKVDIIRQTNGFVVFNGIPSTCIVVPARSDESNKVFSLIVENDSGVKINEVSVMVGFPDTDRIMLDSTKWHAAQQHASMPGWKFAFTNIQCWAAQSPWPLYPFDSIEFPPITNFSIPQSNNPTNRASAFRLLLRCPGFESAISANVMFFRILSNETFRPFIAPMKPDTNGIWRIAISPKELEELQK